jgi:hypothetical protein
VSFQDRYGEIVGGPSLGDSYGLSVPIAIAVGAEDDEPDATSGEALDFAEAKIFDGYVWPRLSAGDAN